MLNKRRLCFINSQITIALILISKMVAYAVVLNLNEITKIYESEKRAKITHDIIFCGDFKDVQVDYRFAESYQFAVQPENWILDSVDGLNQTIETDGNSIIIYFAPSTQENFFIILDIISSFFAEVNMTTIKSNRRIFFVSWPDEVDDAKLNSSTSTLLLTSGQILAKLKTNDDFTNTVRYIRQNEEVYILLWEKQNQSRNGAQYEDTFGITDMIEVYGVLDQLPIIDSLVKDFDYNPNVDVVMEDINTTELLRFAARRKNFRRSRFLVVAQRDESYEAEVKMEFRNGTIRFVSGSSFRILKDFQHMLNFRYKAVAGSGWIEQSKDKKSVTGLGKQIIDKEADICISTSTLEVYRAKSLQFLQPVLIEDSYIFFRQPSITSARNIFVMPFTWNLWYCIGIAWLVIILCSTYIVYKKEGNFRHVGTSRMFSKYKKEQENFHSADVFVWAIGVLCQQGWSTNPMKISTRIVFMTAMTTSVFVYAYYTAAFVAAISAPVIPIKSFDDMKKYQYEVFINPSSPAILIAYVGEAEGRRITAISDKYYYNDSTAIDLILKEGSNMASVIGADAYFAVGAEKHSEAELCQIYQIKPNGSARVKDAMFVRRGSPYKEIFAHKTIVLTERGFQKRYAQEYVRHTQRQCNPTTTINLELEFLECYSAFVILFIGYVVALVSTCFERQKRRRAVKKQMQTEFRFFLTQLD